MMVINRNNIGNILMGVLFIVDKIHDDDDDGGGDRITQDNNCSYL